MLDLFGIRKRNSFYLDRQHDWRVVGVVGLNENPIFLNGRMILHRLEHCSKCLVNKLVGPLEEIEPVTMTLAEASAFVDLDDPGEKVPVAGEFCDGFPVGYLNA